MKGWGDVAVLPDLGRLIGWAARRRRPERVIDRAYPAWLRIPTTLCAARTLENGPPLFSVVMPVRDTQAAFFEAAVDSIRAQTFTFWELCIADDASSSSSLRSSVAAVASDSRVRVQTLRASLGIAGATNAALRLASGVFVALMDHDDLLAPDALACMAAAIESCPQVDVLFSDEDKMEAGTRTSPYFKPGWNPDLMLAQNLVSHLGVYRRRLVEDLGGLREGFDGSQDYDLALRASRAAREIRHVPRVLYHWRQTRESFSATRAQACSDAARRAMRDHLGDGAEIVPAPALTQWTRILYHVPERLPLVSLILSGSGPAPEDEMYRNVEILRADAAGADGDVLVFISTGLVPCSNGWLRELVSQALRAEIGCAGGRLDGPDGAIVHAGYVLDPVLIAQSLRPRSDAEDPGYRGHFQLVRSVAAVSGDCMAIRREQFLAAGGLAGGPWSDVDLCLRLARRGLRCVWTPHARLAYRRVPATRAPDDAMRARWRDVLGCDPYANPNLVVQNGNYKLCGTPPPPRPSPQGERGKNGSV